jgi:hypothetical protein
VFGYVPIKIVTPLEVDRTLPISIIYDGHVLEID